MPKKIETPLSDMAPYDLLRAAAELEKKGESLYRAIAEKIKDKNIVQIFYTLADEEQSHAKIIKHKLMTMVRAKLYDNTTYAQQLLNFMNARIYPLEVMAKKLRRIADPESVFELAISVELDSILFYQDLKNELPEDCAHIIDTLLAEERRHFHRLLQLKSISGA